jgi:hypothetical protein
MRYVRCDMIFGSEKRRSSKYRRPAPLRISQSFDQNPLSRGFRSHQVMPSIHFGHRPDFGNHPMRRLKVDGGRRDDELGDSDGMVEFIIGDIVIGRESLFTTGLVLDILKTSDKQVRQIHDPFIEAFRHALSKHILQFRGFRSVLSTPLATGASWIIRKQKYINTPRLSDSLKQCKCGCLLTVLLLPRPQTKWIVTVYSIRTWRPPLRYLS